MSAANNVSFLGRVVRDAELKTDTLATFSIAINKTYKGNDGERHDQVDFFDMVLLGQRAKLAQYITKGRMLSFRCEARNNSYTDVNGIKRNHIQFVVLDVEFLPTGGSNGSTGSNQSQPAQARPSVETMQTPAAQFAAAPYGYDENIPF